MERRRDVWLFVFAVLAVLLCGCGWEANWRYVGMKYEPLLESEKADVTKPVQ